MSTFREGDWNCPSCGNHNYASKVACNKCQLPKETATSYLGGAFSGGAAGGGAFSGGAAGGTFRAGDWTCIYCGNHNYADKTACNRCHVARADADGSSGGAGSLSGARPLPGASSYGKMKIGQGKSFARSSPYAPQGQVSQGTLRTGDWVCSMCSNHNFASRMACNKCQMPRGSNDGNPYMPGGGAGASPRPLPQMGKGKGGRPGEWICRACTNLNYASREVCNKCGISKTTFIDKKGMKPGDWVCPQCDNHNYKDKTHCNKCEAPLDDTCFVKGHNLREGDWICESCNNHNFKDKLSCNRCGDPKPPQL